MTKVLHTILIEPYQRKALRELSKDAKVNMSEYMRWAIDLMLEEVEKGRLLSELEPHTHHWKTECEKKEAESFKNRINGLTGSNQEVK